MLQPLRLSVARLWFRRWSRSRAAVFHSLSAAVMIGRLSSSILDSLARKSRTLAVEREASGDISYQVRYKDEDEELLISTLYGGQTLCMSLPCLIKDQHRETSISKIDSTYIMVRGLWTKLDFATAP
ncbi:MAG: hypothetical protein Q4A64_08485 [Porphyromonadaceae bacterium]|nr:hypothetical protein [Porphyromonadaceae bacterium]